MTKKLIDVRSDSIDICGYTIDYAIDLLTELKGRYSGDAVIVFNTEYEGDTDFVVKVQRLENDDEYNKRIAVETILAQRTRNQELEQLAKLKAKYETKA